MEFLKDIFGGEPLTYDQLAEKLQGCKDVKLGNLAGGQYVQREKLTTIETERDALKAQLIEANAQIEQFSGMDIDGIKAKAEEWKSKYESETQTLKDQLAEKDYGFTVKESTAGIQFSSESARRAFVSDLTAKKLPMQDGKLLGLEDFVKGYKESDPDAFAPDGGMPRIVLGGKPQAMPEVTREQYQKMGYVQRLKLKTEQPELYKELSAK